MKETLPSPTLLLVKTFSPRAEKLTGKVWILHSYQTQSGLVETGIYCYLTGKGEPPETLAFWSLNKKKDFQSFLSFLS